MYCRSIFGSLTSTIQEALEAKGYIVRVNTAKPRIGSFVVTIQSEDPCSEDIRIVEFLDVPKPFTVLQQLDTRTVVDAIVAHSLD